jgi:cell division protease FtsH
MTGTGKTVLVREIAKHLKTKIIQIDLGEYTGTKDKDIGYQFYNNYSDLSEKPCIILIDEFHISRTLDIQGSEIDRQNIRSLWSLLSDGIITVDTNSITRSLAYLDWQLENDIEKFNSSKKAVNKYENSSKIDSGEAWMYKQHKDRLEDPSNFLFNGFSGMQPEDYAKILKLSSIKDFSKLLNKDFVKTCEDIRKNLKNIEPQPKLDYTKSIIFVVGNLDELYTGSDSFDPDLDVSLLKERNKNITVIDVKENLSKRFRVEQISRLGNNHVIYPPLDEEAYYKIIEKDLIRLKDFYSKKDINLTFDRSVSDIIYKEGVFPNQGARSVLSTIGSFLEPVIVKFNYLYKQKKVKRSSDIVCSYNNVSKMFVFKYGKDGKITVPAQLSLDSFRIPVTNNKSVVCAVHEAGHIIASIFKLGDIPTKTSIFKTNGNGTTELSPKSSKTEMESFEDSLNHLVVMLAGQAAEKSIFKDNNISLGASGDIEKATRLVLELVQDCGYTGAFALNRSDGYLE